MFNHIFKIIGLVLFLGLCLVYDSQTQESKRTGGRKLYTPTELEWFIVNLNSQSEIFDKGSSSYIRFTTSKDHPNWVIIEYVYEDPNAEPLDDQTKEKNEQIVMRSAENSGYDTWLKVGIGIHDLSREMRVIAYPAESK